MKFEVATTPYGPLPAYFKCSKLTQICVPDEGVQTGPFGSQLHQRDYVSEGTPIITVEHLGENRIIHQDLPKVSDDDRERLARYKLRVGDIVFSRVGSVDRRSLVREGEDGWLFSGRCLRVRPNTKLIDPHYLSWFFGLPAFKEYIRGIAVGATMPSLNTDILSNVLICYPSLSEQHQIASVLDAIDEKIDLNREMNKTLEKIGQALFKHWFIHFEFPDEKGKPYKSSGGEMVDSELGEIPKGWGVGKIEDEFKTVLGGTPSTTNKSYWENGTVAWINSGKINEFRITEPTAYITEEAVNNSATKLLPKGTTVLAITGATLGQVSRIEIDTCANQSVIGIIESENIHNEYIYFWIKYTIDEIIRHQTGGAQQHINKNNVDNSKILIPSAKVIQGYQKVIKPIFDKISLGCFEIKELSQIRDSLLPKLMSGKIRVRMQ